MRNPIPESTWDRIIQTCEDWISHLQGYSVRPQTDYVRQAKALMAATAKLRAHPQLEKLVPMRSLLTLCWLPSKTHKINLFCDDIDQCEITIIARGDEEIVQEKKIVSLDQVADEIYAYILQLDDGATL